jgi:hypothetical protein
VIGVSVPLFQAKGANLGVLTSRIATRRTPRQQYFELALKLLLEDGNASREPAAALKRNTHVSRCQPHFLDFERADGGNTTSHGIGSGRVEKLQTREQTKETW